MQRVTLIKYTFDLMKNNARLTKKKSPLQRYFELVPHNSKAAREEILKLPYAADGYLLSRIALTYRDEAMFFVNGNSKKKIIESKLLLAKKYIDEALNLQPDCRDILYLKGTIYFSLNERLDAIDCYIKIIEDGLTLNEKYNCSKSDLPFVKMIINDSHLQLYRLFKNSNIKLANKFLKKYKKELKEGIKTIYIPLTEFL